MMELSVQMPRLPEVPDAGKAQAAMARALNYAARRARTEVARRIRLQVAFPASYLAPSGGRLRVHATARKGRLEAAVAARREPTGLARFARGAAKKKVSVMVKPGQLKHLRRAFFLPLRGGNRGVAVRLRAGEAWRNKRVAARPYSRHDPNLFLLYGPSVQQAFLTDRQTGIARDIEPMIVGWVEQEFLRQLRTVL